MILRIFLLAYAIISPSLGLMDLNQFSDKFEKLCFQNDNEEPYKINGQDMPLSNTLENFIALAEKFEVVNPLLDLKKELVYFITEYLFENIEFVNGKANEWTVGRGKLQKIKDHWDPDGREEKPNVVDPFADAEKCSLYHMISHSLLDQDSQLLIEYSPRNLSQYSPRFGREFRVDIQPEDYYPQEIGVVAIRGTNSAVSMSKVLIGLYVGLLPDRIEDISSFFKGGNDVEKQEDRNELSTDKLDKLYAVTLVDILMQSHWPSSKRPGLALNGKWLSTELSDKSIDGFCPMVYKQEKRNGILPAYSYSSVRGAADGLILGLSISEVYQKKANSKLSQILRMYYSPDGIPLETPIEETNIKKASFCNRQDLLHYVENKLHVEMLAYGYVAAFSWDEGKQMVNNAETTYKSEKPRIYDVSDEEIQKYCSRALSTEKAEDLPREPFLDVIVVMDSSNSENSFQEQQMIVGYLAKQLELRYTGSRMTILLDHKITPESGTRSKIELEHVVNASYSSSCAACMVGQIPYKQSTISRDEIIVAINHFLQERKINETNYSGVSGKVVVYFNYESAEERNGANNNKIQGSLEKALRDLHLEHQDIIFYAVGLNRELLKKYAKDDPALVFVVSDPGETYEKVAKKIYDRLTVAPALLQYGDCILARNERAAVYENFVSPYKIQHYEMPAEYFYKSTSLTISFESQNGYINVCHSRATMKPENVAKYCKNTTANSAAEFKVSHPCSKNLRKESCSPIYFSIMGMDTSPDMMRQDPRPRNYCDDLKDLWCGNLDQIKYKVSHTGVRCSGCLGLTAPPAVILFTVLLAYFIHKHF